MSLNWKARQKMYLQDKRENGLILTVLISSGSKRCMISRPPRSSLTIGPYSLCKDVNAWWYLSRSNGPKIYFIASKFIEKELSKVYKLIFLCLVKRCYAVLITSIPVASFRSMDKAQALVLRKMVFRSMMMRFSTRKQLPPSAIKCSEIFIINIEYLIPNQKF